MNDAHDNAEPDNAGAVFATISPAPGGVIRLLEPERDAEAAAILAASTYAGIAGAGQTLLERAR